MHPVLSMRMSGRYDESDTDVSNQDALNDLMKTVSNISNSHFFLFFDIRNNKESILNKDAFNKALLKLNMQIEEKTRIYSKAK